jgi:hypothetical protein
MQRTGTFACDLSLASSSPQRLRSPASRAGRRRLRPPRRATRRPRPRPPLRRRRPPRPRRRRAHLRLRRRRSRRCSRATRPRLASPSSPRKRARSPRSSAQGSPRRWPSPPRRRSSRGLRSATPSSRASSRIRRSSRRSTSRVAPSSSFATCARFNLAGETQRFQYQLVTDARTGTWEVIARGLRQGAHGAGWCLAAGRRLESLSPAVQGGSGGVAFWSVRSGTAVGPVLHPIRGGRARRRYATARVT